MPERERAFYFCRMCRRGDVIDKGEPTGTCECGSTEWISEDEIFAEPTEFEISLNDRRFLRSIKIAAD